MSETRWLNESEQRIWRTYLLGAAELWERLDHALRPFNLSLNEYSILVCLSEGPDQRLRMSELADAVHQSRSRLTHTISRMEDAGLVQRTASRSDRRGVWAELTSEGIQLLEESASAHVESVRRHFIDPAGSADWEALGRVFEGLLDTARDDGTMTPRHFTLVAPTPTSEPDDESEVESGDESEVESGDESGAEAACEPVSESVNESASESGAAPDEPACVVSS